MIYCSHFHSRTQTQHTTVLALAHTHGDDAGGRGRGPLLPTTTCSSSACYCLLSRKQGARPATFVCGGAACWAGAWVCWLILGQVQVGLGGPSTGPTAPTYLSFVYCVLYFCAVCCFIRSVPQCECEPLELRRCVQLACGPVVDLLVGGAPAPAVGRGKCFIVARRDKHKLKLSHLIIIIRHQTLYMVIL